MKLPSASDVTKPLRRSQYQPSKEEAQWKSGQCWTKATDAFRQGLERGFSRFQQGKEALEEIIRRLYEHNSNQTFISSVTGFTEDHINKVWANQMSNRDELATSLSILRTNQTCTSGGMLTDQRNTARPVESSAYPVRSFQRPELSRCLVSPAKYPFDLSEDPQ